MRYDTFADATERVTVWRKGTAGVSPEAWAQVGSIRRARIERVSDNDALRTGVILDAAVTHEAKVKAMTDYETAGSGSRILRRERDGQNYMILRVTEAGRPGRDGRTRYLRLSLSEIAEEV